LTRRTLVLLAAALAFGPRPASAQRVVLVSVDGLRPDFYLNPEAHGAELPTFRSLMREGVYAEAVEGVYPTVTYPSHTSIVTGALPARHGILNNYIFDEKGRFEDWYWRSDSIRMKTLWDVAPGTTAAIQWPVTVGARIDVNLPEFWIPGSDTTWAETMKGVASRRILDEAGELPPGWLDEEPLEDFVFRAAEIALEKHRPELLLVHVVNTDTKQHRYGREHREVAAAFERVDRALGRLRDRIGSLGLAGETLLVVTGDHGFIQVHSAIQLNSRLREEGLLELGTDGAVRSFRAIAWPSGGSCFLMLKDPEDAETRRRVEALVAHLLAGPLGGVMVKVEREELDRLGAMPEALFALDAREGYMFGKKLEGPLLTPSEDLGHHGSLPANPRMKTGFLMVGPRVRKGVVVPYMRQIDIAPTIALWAGWDLPQADGLALRGLFEEND
jgi:predicted AlkP superfamily pyrophosphatase or phosphodiesterase